MAKEDGYKNLIPLSEVSEERKREITKAGSRASVKARAERKEKEEKRREVAETLKKVLLDIDPKSGTTYLEIISKQCGINTAKRGTLKDLKALAEIWGELTQDINVHADTMPDIDLQVIGGDDEKE